MRLVPFAGFLVVVSVMTFINEDSGALSRHQFMYEQRTTISSSTDCIILTSGRMAGMTSPGKCQVFPLSDVVKDSTVWRCVSPHYLSSFHQLSHSLWGITLIYTLIHSSISKLLHWSRLTSRVTKSPPRLSAPQASKSRWETQAPNLIPGEKLSWFFRASLRMFIYQVLLLCTFVASSAWVPSSVSLFNTQ